MRASETGFTLIEVLVALVASAMLLAIVMDGALLARDRAGRAAETREAVLLARDLLRRAGAADYEGRRTEGREGSLAWTLSERPAIADPRGLWVLAEIEVTVAGRGGARLFAGATRRLKQRPAS